MTTETRTDFPRRLIWAMIALLGAATLYSLISHNVFAQSIAVQALAVALIVFFLKRRATGASTFIRRGILAVAVAVAALHAVLAPLPITTVGLTVLSPPASAEVVVVLAKREKLDDPVPAWVSANRDVNRLNFLLLKPILGEQKLLKIMFSRDNRRYRLAEIEYGTDYFRLPFALVRVKDDDFARVARYNDDNNRLEAEATNGGIIYDLSSKIRSKPTLSIPASESFVRHETKSSRANFIRLIWFFTHLAIILALWHRQRLDNTSMPFYGRDLRRSRGK